jgi:uncharacterized protein
MVKPGTERQRVQASGSRRGGDRDGEGRGQGRRSGAGARPPRPTGSALTSPPVGAPSVAVLAEAPQRRPERERERDRGGPQHGGGGPRSGPPRGRPAGPDSAPGTVEGHTRPAPGPGGPPGRGGQGGPYPPGPNPRGRHDRGPGGRPGPRPSRPAPPPPPLSKDALAGNVPLRTFGQLKQLWEARIEGPADEAIEAAPSIEATALDQVPQPASPPLSDEEPVVPAATAPPGDAPQDAALPLETSDG